MRGRRRRYRPTSPRLAVLAKTHWSEGKGLQSFRRLRPRRRRARMRKFLVAAPKLFAAAYGERRRLTINSSRRRALSIGEKFVFSTITAVREQRFARHRDGALALSSALLNSTSSLRRRLHFAKHTRPGLTRRKTAALLRKRGRTRF